MSLWDKLTILTDVVETTPTETITDDVLETSSTIGDELQNIWNSGIDFANSHSKVFAIIISGIVALALIGFIIFIVKKIKCKKNCKRYYKKRR